MKTLKRILIVLMILIIPMTVIGCASGKKNGTSIVGTYAYESDNIVLKTDSGITTTADLDAILEITPITDSQRYLIDLYLNLIRLKFYGDKSFDIGLETSTLGGGFLVREDVYLSQFLKEATMDRNFKLSNYTSYKIENGYITFNLNITEDIEQYIGLLLVTSDVDGMEILDSFSEEEKAVAMALLKELFKNGIKIAINKDNIVLTLDVYADDLLDVYQESVAENADSELEIDSEYVDWLKELDVLTIDIQLAKI